MSENELITYWLDAEGTVAGSLLTVPEAARYLGMGKRMVYQLIAHGAITAVRVKGSTRIEKKSLDAFRARGGQA
jgi:excisionase family DNA binding protein